METFDLNSMKIIVAIILILIFFIALIWLARRFAFSIPDKNVTEEPKREITTTEKHFVRISDVPRVFQQLKDQGSDGAFAVFMFSDHGKSDEQNIINLQFSIENKKVGLDWVLLAPVNIRDEQLIIDFLKNHNLKPRRITQNDVTYLRIENDNIVQICQNIMSEMYGIKPENKIDFLSEGFKWNTSI